jgi:hypothetical protein
MRGSAIVANCVYVGQQTTRDGAVRDTQAWKLAFTEEGRTFALSNGFQGSMLGLVLPRQKSKRPVSALGK